MKPVGLGGELTRWDKVAPDLHGTLKTKEVAPGGTKGENVCDKSGAVAAPLAR